MFDLFDEYDIVLLDASFFISEFSIRLKESLKKKDVLVSGTFQNEVRGLQAILPQDKRIIYDKNLEYLNYNVEFHRGKVYNDLLDTVAEIKGRAPKIRLIVITANKLLIERIILTGINVDIYNLKVNRILTFDSFSEKREKYELKSLKVQSDEFLPRSTLNSCHGQTVYMKDGGTIILGEELFAGTEAWIYKVGKRRYVIAKIFKDNGRFCSKVKYIEKIIDISKSINVSWAAFPTNILYYDLECKIPIGFIEQYVKEEQNLDDNPLWIGDIDNLTEKERNVKLSENISLCVKLVRQVYYLSIFGFYVSDYNKRNFAIVEDESRSIQMWDTDSFNYGQFFSGMDDGSERLKDYDLSNKVETINFSFEALYSFIFSILTLGDTPIYNGNFKYVKKDKNDDEYQFLYLKNLIPQNIWQLFEKAFCGNRSFSLEMLLSELIASLDELERYPDLNMSYGDLLSDVLEPEPLEPEPPKVEPPKAEPPEAEPPKAESPESLEMLLSELIASLDELENGRKSWWNVVKAIAIGVGGGILFLSALQLIVMLFLNNMG